ncbi:MAG: helix-turn-helix transcriptional regulator [Patescibacteria group bacterium]|nr:helix-turn-helix transcriptional regulator [Patescibacteria group bacterium]
MNEHNAPFTTLGHHLKYVREQSQQSLAEVSGAVEIDELSLERIESGQERPAEDILLLLISHFDVQDREAVQLWELANYGSEIPEQIRPDIDPQHLHGKSTVMLLAMDMRIMYSDGIEAASNKAGITLNFTQASAPGQASSVAKVGMSYDQAHQVLQTIQTVLWHAQHTNAPKALPPPNET